MELKATMGAMTGNASEDIKTLYNYVFQMTEEMRYLMNNLDVTNFNDLGLARYENGRLQVYSEIVEVRASKLESIIQGVEDEFGQLESSFTQTANSVSAIVKNIGSEGSVTAASIIAAINNDYSEVMIKADKVDISGFVTFSDLSGSGQTTINGDNIKTGTLQGINFVALGSSAQGEEYNSFRVIDDDKDAMIGGIGYQYFVDEGTTDNTDRSDKLWIRTVEYRDYPTIYHPSIKIEAAGGVSVESRDGHGVFIYDGSGTEWMFKGGYLYKDGTKVL